MFEDASQPLFGCIVGHEMELQSIMPSELTRPMCIGVHYVAGIRTPRYSTHGKTHFQTHNAPLKLAPLSFKHERISFSTS